jgi:hypothetical protein
MMRTLEDKITDLDTASEHLGRAYDLLARCGFTGLANAVLELCDEISTEIADHEDALDELNIDDDSYDEFNDGQPDEHTEWMDFDPDC